MVIVTTIYMVATIFICIYNSRSAKAAKEQVDQMKLQYQNDLRIRMMPCLTPYLTGRPQKIHGTISFSFGPASRCKRRSNYLYFRIVNTGHDLAKEIRYTLTPDLGINPCYHVFSLPVGESRNVRINVKCSFHTSTVSPLEFSIYYQDLFGTRYHQEFSVILSCNRGKACVETYFISVPQVVEQDDSVIHTEE